MSSKKKKPDRKPRLPRPPLLPHELHEAIVHARDWGEEGRHAEALDLLQWVDRRYPNNPQLLDSLGVAASRAGNNQLALSAFERLAVVVPPSPTLQLNRALAHASCGFFVLAHRYCQTVLDQWPDHPGADSARSQMERLDHTIPLVLAQLGVPATEVLELAVRHEQVQVWLALGKFVEARRVATQILARWPTFLPAMNNLAEAWLLEGNLDQAIASTRQSLQVVPQNAHARANLVRFLALAGKRDEARAEAVLLRSQPVQRPADRVTTAEALSVLGDDPGVLAVYSQAEQEGFQLHDEQLALLHHLAGMAACRLGDEERARTLWNRALRAVPGFRLTIEAIAELDRLQPASPPTTEDVR
jgi:tetratricopeptide (TPR) repeat protein